MRTPSRSHLSLLTLSILSLLTMTQVGCRTAPAYQLSQARMQTLYQHRQKTQIAAQLSQTQQMAAQLEAEKQQLAAANAQLSAGLNEANGRLAGMNAHQVQLSNKYQSLLTGLQGPQIGLPNVNGSLFADLANKYPQFEFDAARGVAMFDERLFFDSGSDALRPESLSVLNEFTSIMNRSEARQFRVLVVGHTDDQPIRKAATKEKHPTNWDLSAHRATAVVKQLAKFGLEEPRLGIAGYSMYQPTQPNASATARQQNRRVEIYILPAHDPVASLTPKRN